MSDRANGLVEFQGRRVEFEVRAGIEWGYSYCIEVAGRGFAVCTCPDFREALEAAFAEVKKLLEEGNPE